MSNLTHCFEYLDFLRESGKVNMFGAAPYLAVRFDIHIRDARRILGEWQKTFDPGKSPEERADEL